MRWGAISEGDAVRSGITATLVFVFGLSVVWGWMVSPQTPPNLVSAIVASAGLWLAAAILGMWSPSNRHLSAVLNSLAASSAAFAGIAALTGLH